MSHSYNGRRRGPDRAALVVILGAAAAIALVVAASFYLTADPAGEGHGSQSASSAGTASAGRSASGTDAGSQPPAQPEGGASGQADPVEPEQKGPVEPEQTEPAGQSGYDFTQPAPASDPVDNSYFDDAAFVGDSRTDGFMIYSGIGTGKNLTSNGLSIFKLGEKKALKIGGKDYTLLEALALEQYGKVYLSLGVNELGYYDDQGFYDSYCTAIDEIRKLQPDAVIYIQGLIPLNEGQIAASTGRTYLTNDHLRIYNDLMRQVAQEKQVVFLDLYPEFVDENGQLPAEYSKDGVHLYKEPCQRWLEYLKTHTVDFDTLYPGGAEGAAAQTT